MQNGIFKLGWSDVGQSIVTAVFVAVVVALCGVVQTPGFNLFTADWGTILSQMLNVGFISLIGVLGKNLMTTSDGRVLGIGTSQQ